MTNVCFIDCETTGLDPRHHVVWEIGLVLDGQSYEWQLELTRKELARADTGALRVSDYYERRIVRAQMSALAFAVSPRPNWSDGLVRVVDRGAFADRLAEAIGSRHLAGNAVAFDDRFVGDFIRRNGRVPAWHYHLVDVEALAAGWLRQPPPWKSADLSKAVGIDPDAFPRHTALGDAQWAQAIYEAVMGGNQAGQAT